MIDRRRRDQIRLGFALQLCTARFLGTFLNDPTEAPPGAVAVLARQLGVTDPMSLARYAASERRYDHAVEIRAATATEISRILPPMAASALALCTVLDGDRSTDRPV